MKQILVVMLNLIVAFILSFSIAVAGDPCRFEYLGKGVIDITTLGHTDGTPAFPNRKPANASATSYRMPMLFCLKSRDFIYNSLLIPVYSYNPCRTFSSLQTCQNIAVCQCEHSNEMKCSLKFL